MKIKEVVEQLVTEIDIYGLDYKFCEIRVDNYFVDCTVIYKGSSYRKIELLHVRVHRPSNGTYLTDGICDIYKAGICSLLQDEIDKLNKAEEKEYAN